MNALTQRHPHVTLVITILFWLGILRFAFFFLFSFVKYLTLNHNAIFNLFNILPLE